MSFRRSPGDLLAIVEGTSGSGDRATCDVASAGVQRSGDPTAWSRHGENGATSLPAPRSTLWSFALPVHVGQARVGCSHCLFALAKRCLFAWPLAFACSWSTYSPSAAVQAHGAYCIASKNSAPRWARLFRGFLIAAASEHHRRARAPDCPRPALVPVAARPRRGCSGARRRLGLPDALTRRVARPFQWGLPTWAVNCRFCAVRSHHGARSLALARARRAIVVAARGSPRRDLLASFER